MGGVIKKIMIVISNVNALFFRLTITLSVLPLDIYIRFFRKKNNSL